MRLKGTISRLSGQERLIPMNNYFRGSQIREIQGEGKSETSRDI